MPITDNPYPEFVQDECSFERVKSAKHEAWVEGYRYCLIELTRRAVSIKLEDATLLIIQKKETICHQVN